MVVKDDYVKWLTEKTNQREWFGTVQEVNGNKARVLWIVSHSKTKEEWNPISRLQKVDELPIYESSERKSKDEFISCLERGYHEWYKDGKCHANQSELFLGYSTPRPNYSLRLKLEQACNGCKVMLICRAEALLDDSEGWWGGMDVVDRRRWAKQIEKGEVSD